MIELTFSIPASSILHLHIANSILSLTSKIRAQISMTNLFTADWAVVATAKI